MVLICFKQESDKKKTHIRTHLHKIPLFNVSKFNFTLLFQHFFAFLSATRPFKFLYGIAARVAFNSYTKPTERKILSIIYFPFLFFSHNSFVARSLFQRVVFCGFVVLSLNVGLVAVNLTFTHKERMRN